MCLGLELGFGSQGAITTLNVGGVCMPNSYLFINVQKVIQCDRNEIIMLCVLMEVSDDFIICRFPFLLKIIR